MASKIKVDEIEGSTGTTITLNHDVAMATGKTLPAASLTGTVADARISTLTASKLTGALPAISGANLTGITTNLDDIKADITALALREATNESSAAFNLPSSFIETFTDDTNLGTETTCDRLSGYMHTKPITTVTTVVGAGDWTGNTGSFTIGTGTMDTTTGDDSVHITGSEWESGTGDFTFTWVPTSFSGHGGGGGIIGFFDKAEVATFNGPDTDGNLDNMTNSWYVKGCCDSTPTYSGNIAYYDGSIVANQTFSHTDGANTVMKFKRRSGVFSLTENVSSGGETTLYTWANTGSQSCYFVFGDNGGAGHEATSMSFETETAAWSATGTLTQAANAVTETRTKVGGTMLYKDNEGTATLGTGSYDLKIEFSCNGGTNWTEAASYNAITPAYSSGIKMVRLGVTTCTGGTDVRYRATWANQSEGSLETQLHGIGINY